MNKLRQLLFDFTNVGEWRIVVWAKNIAWKIKDYDRLEYDYSCVLDHATCSEMSKTYYDKTTIYAVIDSKQEQFYYSIVKSDILEIIANKGDIEDIYEYVNNLTD